MKRRDFIPEQRHIENSRLARRGLKPPAPPHRARQVAVTLEQDEKGEWFVRLGKSKNLLPATDVEVALWLQIQELKTQLARM